MSIQVIIVNPDQGNCELCNKVITEKEGVQTGVMGDLSTFSKLCWDCHKKVNHELQIKKTIMDKEIEEIKEAFLQAYKEIKRKLKEEVSKE
jgi:hypothetical protein